MIAGYLPTGRLMDVHHHRGRMALLRLRGSQQFNTSTGRALFRVTHEHAVSPTFDILISCSSLLIARARSLNAFFDTRTLFLKQALGSI